jgi:enoyl-CoA hydratase/carnithine racemase
MSHGYCSSAERLDGGACRITLSGGCLSAAEARALASTIAGLTEDRSVRSLILDSAGADFCPGGADDFDPLSGGLDPTVPLSALRFPVIAVLRGRVLSVGLELALAADIRLADRTAVFAIRDVAAGRLPCWGGTQRLPRIVGVPHALRMLLLSEQVDAADASDIGLVHEIVRDPAARATEIVKVWSTYGSLAMEYAKEAVLRGAEMPFREGLALEADLNTMLQVSSDRAEGIAAFLNKRAPKFVGR